MSRLRQALAEHPFLSGFSPEHLHTQVVIERLQATRCQLSGPNSGRRAA